MGSNGQGEASLPLLLLGEELQLLKEKGLVRFLPPLSPVFQVRLVEINWQSGVEERKARAAAYRCF